MSVFFLPLLLAVFLLASCGKKKKNNTIITESGDALKIEVKKSSTDLPSITHYGTAENGEVCVLFGYGFNDQSFCNRLLAKLSSVYGLESDGGRILPLVFPDDLKGRIGNLYNEIDKRNIIGIVMLGAPEHTNAILAGLQDDYEGKLPYPVFSLFPQDDILGQEATCDFVLEYEHKSEEEILEEQIVQEVNSADEDAIIRFITFIFNLDTPLEADSSLHPIVQGIVGNRKF